MEDSPVLRIRSWIGGGGEIRTRGPRSGRRFSRPFLRQDQHFNDNSWLAKTTCSFIVICHFHYFSYFAHFADFPIISTKDFRMVLKQPREAYTFKNSTIRLNVTKPTTVNQLGRRKANAAIAPGNQCNFSLQFTHIFLLSCHLFAVLCEHPRFGAISTFLIGTRSFHCYPSNVLALTEELTSRRGPMHHLLRPKG